MAKVKIQGHASGTGVLTVTAPNTNTDRTITLPDSTGTLLNSDGSGANLTNLPADSSKVDKANPTITNDLTIDDSSSTPTINFRESDGTNKMTIGFATNSTDVCEWNSIPSKDIRLSLGGTNVWQLAGNNKHITHSNTGSIPTNEGVFHIVNNNNTRTLMVDSTKTSGVDQDTMRLQNSQDSSNGSYDLLTGRNGGGQVFKVQDSGKAYNTTNTWGSLSDQRVKQDIADASSQWDDIKAIKVRKYKLKKLVNRDGADNTPYHIGVVAQELESAGITNLVDESKPEKEDVALHSDFGTIDSEGVFTAGENKKEVKYSILYMKSIKALQEAMARIETLEAKVTALENA